MELQLVDEGSVNINLVRESLDTLSRSDRFREGHHKASCEKQLRAWLRECEQRLGAPMRADESVEAQLYVSKLHSFDPIAKTFELEGYFRSWWADPRLNFDNSSSM